MENAHTRKKQPEVIRRALLDNAAKLAAEGGVAAVTLQAVAMATGVTKGGLIHHFSSKQALIDAVFKELMDAIDQDIDMRMAKDALDYGSFTRAYVEMTFADNPSMAGGNLVALSTTMLMDAGLRDTWNSWLKARLKRHNKTDGDIELAVVRLAADGVWLADLAKTPLPNRKLLRAQLISATQRA